MDINILGGVSTSPIKPSLTGVSPTVPPTQASASVSGASANANAAPVNSASANPSPEQVKQAVDNINAFLSESGNPQSVQFSIDPDSKNVIVQIVDSQTKTVIRQIPSEDIIQIGKELGKRLGIVIDQQA